MCLELQKIRAADMCGMTYPPDKQGCASDRVSCRIGREGNHLGGSSKKDPVPPAGTGGTGVGLPISPSFSFPTFTMGRIETRSGSRRRRRQAPPRRRSANQ